jgi:hypothetical protein
MECGKLAIWLLTGVVCCICVEPVQAGSLTFTDWTTVNTTTNIAVGTLGSVTVTMSGGDIYSGIINRSFTHFDRTFFTPSLVNSDVVSFLGPNSPSIMAYTVSFSAPVTNPRIHLASLASTIDFGKLPLSRLSGQGKFLVSGSKVTGSLLDGVPPPNDANGTIELLGTFSSFAFTARAVGTFSGGGDGINFQVGADVSRNGLTWIQEGRNPITGTVLIGCGDACDPNKGDRACTEVLPLLCIRKSGPGFPLPVPADVNNADQNGKWSGGVIATTAPLVPPSTLAGANAACVKSFGSDWRVAEFHDGLGWKFQAYGGVGDATKRFWVHINDQPQSNCWQ